MRETNPTVLVQTATEIRQAYGERWPGWTQQMITRFSGKALGGQAAPRLVLGPISGWIAVLGQLVVTALIGATVLTYHPILGVALLPVVWLAILNALRKLHTTYSHYSVHGEVSRRPRINRLVQALSSTVSLAHNYDDYLIDHVRGHHSRRVFTTAADPDAAFLLMLGFRPGMSSDALWRRLRRTLVSPRFHGLFLLARWRTNFTTASWPRRTMAAAWVTILTVVAITTSPWVVILTVVIPLLPLYHVSALLQFMTEHAWMVSERGPRDAEEYARRTWARFSLEPLPRAGRTKPASVWAWARWARRVVTVHVPFRYGVLAGDLAVHDYHHLNPRDKIWWKAVWSRQLAIEAGQGRGMEQREFTGPESTIQTVFDGLASAPREVCLPLAG